MFKKAQAEREMKNGILRNLATNYSIQSSEYCN